MPAYSVLWSVLVLCGVHHYLAGLLLFFFTVTLSLANDNESSDRGFFLQCSCCPQLQFISQADFTLNLSWSLFPAFMYSGRSIWKTLTCIYIRHAFALVKLIQVHFPISPCFTRSRDYRRNVVAQPVKIWWELPKEGSSEKPFKDMYWYFFYCSTSIWPWRVFLDFQKLQHQRLRVSEVNSHCTSLKVISHVWNISDFGVQHRPEKGKEGNEREMDEVRSAPECSATCTLYMGSVARVRLLMYWLIDLLKI